MCIEALVLFQLTVVACIVGAAVGVAAYKHARHVLTTA